MKFPAEAVVFWPTLTDVSQVFLRNFNSSTSLDFDQWTSFSVERGVSFVHLPTYSFGRFGVKKRQIFFVSLAGSEGGKWDQYFCLWCDETNSFSRSLDDLYPVLRNFLPYRANSFLSLSWTEVWTFRTYFMIKNNLGKFFLSKASITQNSSRLIPQIAEIPAV